MKRLTFLASLFLLSTSSAVFAQTSEEYAKLGRTFYNAFRCSFLAEAANEPGERERLFTYGYEQGRIFLKALDDGLIEEEDRESEIPVGVLWELEGPSHDFMLGRIYARVVDALQDLLSEPVRTLFDEGDIESALELIIDDPREMDARTKFVEDHCSIVGID